MNEFVLSVIKKLTKSQRAAILSAQWEDDRGGYKSAGFYLYADKRVLYNLSGAGIVRDYLNNYQRLTPFGEKVHATLLEAEKDA